MAFIILAQVGHLKALGGSFPPLQNSPKSPKRPCCERAVGNPQVHKTSHWDFGFWWDSTEACSRPSLQNNRKPNIKSLVIKLTDDKDLRSSQVQLVNEADLNPGRLRIAKSKLKYLRICNTCLRMGLPWKSLTEGNVKGF